jgi:uridine phosphorylase
MKDLENYVVHLPKPEELQEAPRERASLLVGVRYLILVGSPRRARRIAELAHERFGARRNAEESCYCDLTRPGRDESERELAVYGVELDGGARLAVASHGIGKAGVELVLSELPALITLLQAGEPPDLRGVLRCGTRASLAPVPLGTIALSTSCRNDSLEQLEPSPEWLSRLRAAAGERGMDLVREEEIDARAEAGWTAGESKVIEGPGISTSFFWEGQGRALYRDTMEDEGAGDRLLSSWIDAGIRWIEMEDYSVLRLAQRFGIPAATLGAIVGLRRGEGGFQSGYDKAAMKASELLPAELALEAIRADAR